MLLRPFSHLPKTSCLVPGTSVEAEIYPTLIRFYDLASEKRSLIKEERLGIDGPVDGFTVVQDLEKEVISVLGAGLYYHILPNLTLLFKKKTPRYGEMGERLYLGVNKSQNWEMIRKRLDFKEIFPLWFRLGGLTQETEILPFPLLEEVEETIRLNRPERILPSFKKLFCFSFRSMMVPRVFDDEYQGIDVGLEKGSPLFILKEGMRLIRSLFIEKTEEGVSLLPTLPPEFFSGHLMNVSIPPFGHFSLQWTKKTLRTVLFKSEYEGFLPLKFQQGLKKFRLREHEKERGKSCLCTNELEIKSKRVYLLDRFEK